MCPPGDEPQEIDRNEEHSGQGASQGGLPNRPGEFAGGIEALARRTTGVVIGCQVLSQIVSLAALFCLYKLLKPEDFGLFYMVLPPVMFLRLFSTMGLNQAAVWQAELPGSQVSTLFWCQVVLGLLVAGAIALMAPALGWLYGVELVVPLTLFMSGSSVVVALSAVPQALLERRLLLARLALLRLSAQATGSLVAVLLAWKTSSVWALPLGHYAELFLLALGMIFFAGWRPGPVAPLRQMRDLFHFGGFYTASNVMFNLAQSVDKVIVGALLGPRALGWYSQAYQLAHKSVHLVSTPLGTVMLPLLARTDSGSEVRQKLSTGFYRVTAWCLLPAGAGLAIVADEVVEVLGPLWQPVAPLLRVFAIMLLAQGWMNNTAHLFAASGKTRQLFLCGLFWSVAVASGIATTAMLCHNWGFSIEQSTLWIAWTIVGLTLSIIVPYMTLAALSTQLCATSWLRGAIAPALATGAMAMSLLLCKPFFTSVVGELRPLPLLALEIFIGICVYILFAGYSLRRDFRLMANERKKIASN